MAAPSSLIIHGADDALNDLLDEDNLDMQDIKIKYTREKRERKNHHGNVRRVEMFNPTGSISGTAFMITRSGLADQQPGTRITGLLNYASTRHGFDPTAGTIVLDDVEESFSMEEDMKSAFNATHYLFVTSA